MKPGLKSSEFLLIAAVVIFAALVAFGRIDSTDIEQAAARIQGTAETVPVLIEAVKSLADRFGGLAITAGLAWAYLRRRTALKQQEIKQAKV